MKKTNVRIGSLQNKLGFTLIELLAVIVILAIIALIATPIVLNIIKDSKESATLQSAQFYLDAVEHSITKKMMDEPTFKPSSCEIQTDGNLKCDGIDVKVEISGEVPNNGILTLENGKIKDVELVLGDKAIVKNSEGKLVYGEPATLLYKIGDEVTFDPGDGDKTWNVIHEDRNTVTLMLTGNLGNTFKLYSSKDNSYGPKDALDYLNNLTTLWDNVDPIESYSYINNLKGNTKTYGYQKIEIDDGKAILTHKDGNTTVLEGISKARLITIEEIFEIASKKNENLTEDNLKAYIIKNLDAINTELGISATTVDEVIAGFIQQNDYNFLEKELEIIKLYYTVSIMALSKGIDSSYDTGLPDYVYQNLDDNKGPYGYWTLSTSDNSSIRAWRVSSRGRVSHYEAVLGIRPVITISKSKLLKEIE